MNGDVLDMATTARTRKAAPETDPWDVLIEAAQMEAASTSAIDVPEKVASLVDKVYQNGLRASLPVRDTNHFNEVKSVLVAAAHQHTPPLSVVTRQDLDGDQLFLRFTAKRKLGRKGNSTK